MRILHAVLTVLVFLSCLQLAAQETIAERCHAPRDPFDNQPMPEQFKIPRNSRYRSCPCCLPRILTASASGLYLFAAQWPPRLSSIYASLGPSR